MVVVEMVLLGNGGGGSGGGGGGSGWLWWWTVIVVMVANDGGGGDDDGGGCGKDGLFGKRIGGGFVSLNVCDPSFVLGLDAYERFTFQELFVNVKSSSHGCLSNSGISISKCKILTMVMKSSVRVKKASCGFSRRRLSLADLKISAFALVYVLSWLYTEPMGKIDEISGTSFGTPNTSTKLATADPNNIPSNERDDGSVNVIQSAKSNGMGHVPYANLLNGEPIKKAVNFHTLIAPPGNGLMLPVSIKSVLEVNEHFENSVYGFFLGKKVVYPAVENYFKNSWSRFGLVRTMMNSNGIFFFKFNSNTGMEATLKNGPCLILNVSLMLRKWSSLANVFEDFLLQIIDFRADIELNDTFVVEVPKLEGNGYILHSLLRECEVTRATY
ncbi:zinc knuckle CX2CX4HX4C containing protein [Tanacetum coccineum]